MVFLDLNIFFKNTSTPVLDFMIYLPIISYFHFTDSLLHYSIPPKPSGIKYSCPQGEYRFIFQPLYHSSYNIFKLHRKPFSISLTFSLYRCVLYHWWRRLLKTDLRYFSTFLMVFQLMYHLMLANAQSTFFIFIKDKKEIWF